MQRLTTRLIDYVNRKPTRLPMLVSGTGISMAAALSSLTVVFGLNHNGPLLVAIMVLFACTIAIPAGYIHYLREVDIARQQKRLHELASTDTLTGLMNRRTFERAVEKERARMNRTANEAAIILFDLDWFKSINDNFGHSAGDDVLKTVAELAGRVLRHPVDALARWGGEEFAILLTDVTPDQAYAVTERLREVIDAASFDDLAPGLSVSASFGVTTFTSQSSLHAALMEADHALYQAKKDGRNQTVCRTTQTTPVLVHAV
ncbi:GGDEF domain-containing protein [Henriciella marina]|uniref:GGDEF domain-containing protein n=1 Tax=Henriciella marina TaxID=453851 RepID=UPI00037987E4|nr:GGDEF domain-containing protein [Henriciella marina]